MKNSRPITIFKTLLNPFSLYAGLYTQRDLITQIVKRNIQGRFKGSFLGRFWMFATPVCMLLIYTFVFSVIFKVRWSGNAEISKVGFALVLLCGMAVFNIFAESVIGSVSVICSNPNYVKKVVFPLEVLPFSTVITSLWFGLVWFLILLCGTIIYFKAFWLTAICFPVVMLPLLLLSCGFAWLVASLGVYIRDFAHSTGILMQMLFFLSPVCYDVKMIPERYRFLLNFNPLTGIIGEMRKILIFNQWPDWSLLLWLTLGALLVFQGGYIWFMKTKRGFADVL